MKLAVNYSEPARDLLVRNDIEVDLFKCPPWPDLIETVRQYRPVYVHFALNAGTPGLMEKDWGQVERLLEKTGTPFVNLHLTALNRDFPDIPVETQEPEHVARITAALIRDVSWVCERFGADRVIVENVPYRGTLGSRRTPALKILRPVTEAAVVLEVVEETGCGLLLDTNHARFAAYYMGADPCDYMAEFPVERLRELHVVGGYHDGERFREHVPMTDDDWAINEWVFAQIAAGRWAKPWVVAFEYGRVGADAEARSRPEVLAEQVPRLYEMVAEQGVRHRDVP